MESKESRSRVVAYPMQLPSCLASSRASVEPTQVTASEAIELLNDSPFDDELRYVAETDMIRVGEKMQQQNVQLVAPQLSLHPRPTNLKLPLSHYYYYYYYCYSLFRVRPSRSAGM